MEFSYNPELVKNTDMSGDRTEHAVDRGFQGMKPEETLIVPSGFSALDPAIKPATYVYRPDIKHSGWSVSVTPELQQRAQDVLARTIRNPEKMLIRRALLESHPEQRIRVDTARLQQIIPFLSFKCHPDCSIARDQAIKGSDIDRAVVITEEMQGLEERSTFVNELRRRGFRAYTQEEVEDIGADGGDSARWTAQGAAINFRTVAEVDESVRNYPLYAQNLSVIAGYEVGTV